MNQKEKFQLLDIVRLIAAFMVIGIHTRPFLSIGQAADVNFNYNVANYAVPFFYACTGFFLIYSTPKQCLQSAMRRKIYKTIRIYLLWTAIYLPLTIYGWSIRGRSLFYNVLDFMRNLIIVGENFYSWTLWYLNGLAVALLIIYVGGKRFTMRQLAVIAEILYVIGFILQVLNVRREFLPMPIGKIVKLYFSIFRVTRNGLFESFAFVMIGIIIAERMKEKKILLSRPGVVLSLVLYGGKILLSVHGGGDTQKLIKSFA